MSEAEKEKIQALADMLIATLGDMPAKEADEVVRKVSLVLYNDLLGIQGEIKTGSFRLCTIYGTNAISNVSFVPAQSDHCYTNNDKEKIKL